MYFVRASSENTCSGRGTSLTRPPNFHDTHANVLTKRSLILLFRSITAITKFLRFSLFYATSCFLFYVPNVRPSGSLRRSRSVCFVNHRVFRRFQPVRSPNTTGLFVSSRYIFLYPSRRAVDKWLVSTEPRFRSLRTSCEWS